MPLLSSPPPPVGAAATLNRTSSRVVVGRHGILIRPWPHPNLSEVMRAHKIIERVQKEQREAAVAGRPRRPVIAVTPTYARTFQAPHMMGLVHTLMLLPYELTWIVVEAGGPSNDTATLIGRSGVPVIHLPFNAASYDWNSRHRLDSQMRLHALRVIRERKLDGIVVFLDDSNVHSMEMFDEIQSVKWVGALSVGILAHFGNSDISAATDQNVASKEEKQNLPVPVQGPACNSSGQLTGWHIFKSPSYADLEKLQWSGFVLNSRILWKDAEGRPEWVRDLDSVGENGEEIENPLGLLKDSSFVEPLGNCGKKVMLWWLRAEARGDSKYPPGWLINPPLDITVPAKRTPWPDAPPELPLEKLTEGLVEKRPAKAGRSSRSRHSSRGKRKHDSHASGTIETEAN